MNLPKTLKMPLYSTRAFRSHSGHGKGTQGFFTKTKVYVVSSIMSLAFFLARRVCLKSVKKEMPENCQVRSQGIR
jgi:hypothetical protein